MTLVCLPWNQHVWMTAASIAATDLGVIDFTTQLINKLLVGILAGLLLQLARPVLSLVSSQGSQFPLQKNKYPSVVKPHCMQPISSRFA